MSADSQEELAERVRIHKNRICDEIGEALKLCPVGVIGRIASEVINHVSDNPVDVIFVGDEEFEITRLSTQK